MADTKTLDEHAETVKRLDAVDARLAEVFGPRPESVRAVRDAYEAEREARVAARAALQGVADVVDPNGDHYFWRKKEADLAGTVKSIVEDRERIDAEWRKRAQLGMCVMDAPNGPECWCGAPSEVEAGLCLRHARELERLSHAEKAEARVRELEAERDEARTTALEDAAILVEADAAQAPSRRRALMEAAERIRGLRSLCSVTSARAELYAAANEAERALRIRAEGAARKHEGTIDELEGERLRVALALGATTVDHVEGLARRVASELAETRAQLARLREAAEATERLFSYSDTMQQFVLPANARVMPVLNDLRVALSTPGPTLAEIRRTAQAEVLRDAVDTACDAVLAAVPCCNGTAAVHAVRRSLEKRADDLEAGR